MKNKKIKLILVAVIMMLFNTISAYASDVFYWNGIEIREEKDELVILPENVTRSEGQTRGDVISTGFINITKEGDRKVGLTIETIAHVRCDRICNDLSLQKWNESTEEWENIVHYEFEALQEDNPDEDLIYLINGVDVENLQPGTYRARGIHAVYLGDVYEGYISKTKGIQITK